MDYCNYYVVDADCEIPTIYVGGVIEYWLAAAEICQKEFYFIHE